MSVHFYPVTPIADSCQDYTVKVNGQVITTDTARVSACPFNRRWPGHQRPIDQSELNNFVSFAMDEPVEIEVIPAEPFETVHIRPRALGITPTVCGNSIKFRLDKPAYFTVEPFGRSHPLHIFADSMVDYNIDPADENVIYFGQGEHDVGLLELKSGQTLFLDEGAVVYATVKAYEADNISILGHGILDNSRNKETIFFEACEDFNDEAVNNAHREHTVQLEYCTGIRIDGITIRDSLVYNIRPVCCKDIDIRNVKIIGCWRYNSDGIDMHNCENVVIDNCFLRTFDDCICVKGFDYTQNEADMYHNGISYDVFRNVRVSNCVLYNDWGKCLEIGAETRAKEICDIVFTDCHIIHVMNAVLDCMNVDYADVHNVTFQNMTIEYDDVIPPPDIQRTEDQKYSISTNDYAPDLLCVHVQYVHEYSADTIRRGINRDFRFRNIRLYGRQRPAFYFAGYDETHQTGNIHISGLYHNDVPVTDWSACKVNIAPFCHDITLE